MKKHKPGKNYYFSEPDFDRRDTIQVIRAAQEALEDVAAMRGIYPKESPEWNIGSYGRALEEVRKLLHYACEELEICDQCFEGSME